jgi:hypothetical protein
MIVQMFIKVILFYFAFSVIRNLLKGFTQVKNSQSGFKKSFESTQGGSREASGKKNDDEDIVEAEFRRL